MKGVLMTKMVQELNLTNLTPDIDLSDKRIITTEINRPASAAYRISGAFCKRARSDHRLRRVYVSDAAAG